MFVNNVSSNNAESKIDFVLENEFESYEIIENEPLEGGVNRLAVNTYKEYTMCGNKHIITDAVFYTKNGKVIRLPDEEIMRIVGEVADDDILSVDYYEKCNAQNECEYGNIFIVATKLNEPFENTMFGRTFEYKYHVLDKYGNIFMSPYSETAEVELCK